jgi:hypothetical protein
MEALVSIVSILVMVTVTIVILYQNAQIRDKINSNLQGIVDQMNDSTLYAYKFDQNQDVNIKNLDQNMKLVMENMDNVTHNVKALQMQVNATANPGNTSALTIGNKFTMNTAMGPEWLSVMDAGGKKFYGGVAMGKLYADSDAIVKGTAMVNQLSANGGIMTKGGTNTNNWNTYFPYVDGRNYIRGDTVVNGQLCIGSTCLTEAQLAKIKQVTGAL